jgi:hypothetical protein
MAAKANDVRSLGLALAEGAAVLLAFLYSTETAWMSAFFGLGCHACFLPSKGINEPRNYVIKQKAGARLLTKERTVPF